MSSQTSNDTTISNGNINEGSNNSSLANRLIWMLRSVCNFGHNDSQQSTRANPQQPILPPQTVPDLATIFRQSSLGNVQHPPPINGLNNQLRQQLSLLRPPLNYGFIQTNGQPRLLTNVQQEPTGFPNNAENQQTQQPMMITFHIVYRDQNTQRQQQQPNYNNPELFDARARQRVYSVCIALTTLIKMLLIRIAFLYSISVPKFIRNSFEYSILATAVACFALLVHMHVIFIRSPLTCLDHVKHTWPKHGILRVQIGDGHLDGQFVVPKKRSDDDKNQVFSSNISLPFTYEQYRTFYYNTVLDEDESLFLRLKKIKSSSKQHVYSSSFDVEDDFVDESSLATLTFFNYKKNGAWSEPYIVEYSLEYGLLRLSEAMREHYNVPVMKVVLNPETDKCFGDIMARFMLNNFLGYDDVLIGSIKRLAEHENNRGFVRNVVTGEHFRFVNVWMTRTSYLAAVFIMIIFTLFVSMLIRYSHQQVFVFVSEFLRSLELQQPVTHISFLAASLITVILALIGMETIMYEFFSDSSITFHVIIMVWAADQFDSIAIQSRITRRHFIRFFYLYQFIFYAYHYRFNGQYSGLALLTTMLFTYHSMIYFFHHFELPLLRNAYIQQIRPGRPNNNHNANHYNDDQHRVH